MRATVRNKFLQSRTSDNTIPSGKKAAEIGGLNDAGVNEVGHQPSLSDNGVLKLLDRRVFFSDQPDREDFGRISSPELPCCVGQARFAFDDLAGHLVAEFGEDVFNRAHDYKRSGIAAAGKSADSLWA